MCDVCFRVLQLPTKYASALLQTAKKAASHPLSTWIHIRPRFCVPAQGQDDEKPVSDESAQNANVPQNMEFAQGLTSQPSGDFLMGQPPLQNIPIGDELAAGGEDAHDASFPIYTEQRRESASRDILQDTAPSQTTDSRTVETYEEPPADDRHAARFLAAEESLAGEAKTQLQMHTSFFSASMTTYMYATEQESPAVNDDQQDLISPQRVIVHDLVTFSMPEHAGASAPSSIISEQRDHDSYNMPSSRAFEPSETVQVPFHRPAMQEAGGEESELLKEKELPSSSWSASASSSPSSNSPGRGVGGERDVYGHDDVQADELAQEEMEFLEDVSRGIANMTESEHEVLRQFWSEPEDPVEHTRQVQEFREILADSFAGVGEELSRVDEPVEEDGSRPVENIAAAEFRGTAPTSRGPEDARDSLIVHVGDLQSTDSVRGSSALADELSGEFVLSSEEQDQDRATSEPDTDEHITRYVDKSDESVPLHAEESFGTSVGDTATDLYQPTPSMTMTSEDGHAQDGSTLPTHYTSAEDLDTQTPTRREQRQQYETGPRQDETSTLPTYGGEEEMTAYNNAEEHASALPPPPRSELGLCQDEYMQPTYRGGTVAATHGHFQGEVVDSAPPRSDSPLPASLFEPLMARDPQTLVLQPEERRQMYEMRQQAEDQRLSQGARPTGQISPLDQAENETSFWQQSAQASYPQSSYVPRDASGQTGSPQDDDRGNVPASWHWQAFESGETWYPQDRDLPRDRDHARAIIVPPHDDDDAPAYAQGGDLQRDLARATVTTPAYGDSVPTTLEAQAGKAESKPSVQGKEVSRDQPLQGKEVSRDQPLQGKEVSHDQRTVMFSDSFQTTCDTLGITSLRDDETFAGTEPLGVESSRLPSRLPEEVLEDQARPAVATSPWTGELRDGRAMRQGMLSDSYIQRRDDGMQARVQIAHVGTDEEAQEGRVVEGCGDELVVMREPLMSPVCTCVHTCMYVLVYIHACMYLCMYMLVCTYVCTRGDDLEMMRQPRMSPVCSCVYTCMYHSTCVYTRVYVHVYLHTCVYVLVYIHACIIVLVYMHACMYLCICMHVCTFV